MEIRGFQIDNDLSDLVLTYEDYWHDVTGIAGIVALVSQHHYQYCIKT